MVVEAWFIRVRTVVVPTNRFASQKFIMLTVLLLYQDSINITLLVGQYNSIVFHFKFHRLQCLHGENKTCIKIGSDGMYGDQNWWSSW